MNCPEVDRVIDAYIDGELGAAEAAEARAHLDNCPACRERVAARASLSQLIRRVPYRSAPNRLRVTVANTRRPARFSPRLLAWAAMITVAVSLGSGAAIRVVRARQATAATVTMAQEVVASHVRALMGPNLFEVRSTDQHTVKPWFAGKLDYSPPVVDLAPIGFPLTGGRLDRLGDRAVAALVYQRRQHTINVFVWPTSDSGEALTDTRTFRGFQVRHWTHDGMAFWAVSDLNDIELDQFVHALTP